MQKWIVVYSDDTANNEIVKEGDFGAVELVRFDEVAEAGSLNGRKIHGMWIIDPATEQEDVIKIFGLVPEGLHSRHANYRRRLATPNK